MDDRDEDAYEPTPEEYARMSALYEGMKRAGLLDPEQARQDIIDAGRGHLVPRTQDRQR